MSRADDQRIADIIDACDELGVVVALRSAGEGVEQVPLRAAERLLEIIGEAASSLTEAARAQYPAVDWAEHRPLAHRAGPPLPPHRS